MKKTLILLMMSLSALSCTFSQKDKGKDFFSIVEESLERNNYVIPDSLFSFFPDKSNKYRDLKILEIFTNTEITENSFLSEEFKGYEIIELYQLKEG